MKIFKTFFVWSMDKTHRLVLKIFKVPVCVFCGEEKDFHRSRLHLYQENRRRK